METSNPFIFAIAIGVTLAMCAIWAIGFYFHKKELRTGGMGLLGWMFYLLLFSIGGLLLIFSQTSVMVADTAAILVGNFIAVGTAYYGSRLVYRMRAGRSR